MMLSHYKFVSHKVQLDPQVFYVENMTRSDLDTILVSAAKRKSWIKIRQRGIAFVRITI